MMPPMLPKPAVVRQRLCTIWEGKKRKAKLTNLPGTPDGPPVVPAQVHVVPAHDDGHGRVRAHADEEQRRVLHGQVVVHIDEDAKARDGDADGAHDEPEPVLGPVRRDGDHHGEAKGHGPGRDGPQLGGDGVVLVALDDGGRKVGVRVGRHDQAKVHEAAEPDLVVGQHGADVAERDLALGRAVALLDPEAGLDKLALVLAKPRLSLLSAANHLFLRHKKNQKNHIPSARGTRGT